MKEYIKFANHLADLSEPIIKGYFRNKIEVITKDNLTPVTKADQEVEKIMRETIAKQFPSHGVFGEEFENTQAHAEYSWVIDPIDGTRSFITGKPIFGTLIALMHFGKPILGIINQPITQERWIGVEGEGSFLNDAKIKTSEKTKVSEAILATTSPDLFRVQEMKFFRNIAAYSKDVVYGGDCYNYALLAMGEIDVVVESGLKIHDFMALVPIIKNAGGCITDWKGNELTSHSDGTVIAAANKELLSQLLTIKYANKFLS